MTDPAEVAAERYWNARGVQREDAYAGAWNGTVAAAREALAPLRAKHQPRVMPTTGRRVCTSCRDAYGGRADWPTGTDRLIYAEEEL